MAIARSTTSCKIIVNIAASLLGRSSSKEVVVIALRSSLPKSYLLRRPSYGLLGLPHLLGSGLSLLLKLAEDIIEIVVGGVAGMVDLGEIALSKRKRDRRHREDGESS
ncbi:hypothetical protein ACLOJK_040867 [Asimina triloba]